MKKIVLVLAMMVVALCGCIGEGPQKEMNATELKQIMVDSVKDLKSYRFTMEMDQTMEFINLSINQSEPNTVQITTVGEGAVDLAGRALRITITNTAVPLDDPENASRTEETENYFINDTMYMKMGGNWTKLAMPMPDDIWSQQNMVKRQVELLNSSSLELLGSEAVDGVDCYKIQVTPDMRTFATILSEQMGSSMPVNFMNISRLFNDSQMTWTAWMTKDDHFLKKNEMQMAMTLTPEILGLPEEIVGKFEMHIDMNTVMVCSDFNKKVEIVLPEEAKQAEPLPLFPLMAAPPAGGEPSA